MVNSASDNAKGSASPRSPSAMLASAQQTAGNVVASAQQTAGTVVTSAQEKAASLQKQGGEAAAVLKERSVTIASAAKAKAEEIVKDRRVQVTAASAAVGGATVGTGGAVAGLVTGGFVGGACGIPFALITFGLSVPVSAMIGGGVGLVTGGAAGTTIGVTTGGAAGFGAYTKRAEIKAAIEKARQVAIYYAARAYAKVKKVKNGAFARIQKMTGGKAQTPTSPSTPINQRPLYPPAGRSSPGYAVNY